MPLEEYQSKQDLDEAPEPEGEEGGRKGEAIFVVQEHHATRLHWDFRLEMGGVLKSWAVPKGPPEAPGIKRLAMMVEDHALDYAQFQGTLPEGEYGAGTVKIWDRGTWAPQGEGRPEESLAQGHLKFVLHGDRLQGGYVLVKMRKAEHNAWLLIKERPAPDGG